MEELSPGVHCSAHKRFLHYRHSSSRPLTSCPTKWPHCPCPQQPFGCIIRILAVTKSVCARTMFGFVRSCEPRRKCAIAAKNLGKLGSCLIFGGKLSDQSFLYARHAGHASNRRLNISLKSTFESGMLSTKPRHPLPIALCLNILTLHPGLPFTRI